MKRVTVMSIVMAAMVREKRAGYWNIVNSISPWERPKTEKAAPIIGPTRKPRENAIPITAYECKTQAGP